jgi:putative ABC transport system ATP-binding protein
MQGISKQYRTGTKSVPVLNEIDLQVASGEFVAVMGPSGSGKSTLLHLLGCLDRPSAGVYLLDGRAVADASDRELSHLRSRQIGFVFQTFHLLPDLNVRENVELPFLYGPVWPSNPTESALAAIEKVGLGHRADHLPAELSGGEMQRVAIARALAVAPKMILADEPTGNLDSETGREIIALFQALNQAGTTIVMVTHDRNVAAGADHVRVLKDGVFA